jgi:hypothetical protein
MTLEDRISYIEAHLGIKVPTGFKCALCGETVPDNYYWYEVNDGERLWKPLDSHCAMKLHKGIANGTTISGPFRQSQLA